MTAPAPYVRRPTKAAQFAEAAEAAGWEVDKRRWRHPETGHVIRQVTATRGDESFQFEWERNPETDRDVFVAGAHQMLDFIEEWRNVKRAVEIVEAPPIHFRTTEVRDPETGETETIIVRLPFDIEAAEDESIKAALACKKVTWRNGVSGARESAWVGDNDFLVIKPDPHVDNEGERIVEFTDVHPHPRTIAERYGTTGFRAFHLSQLVRVG